MERSKPEPTPAPPQNDGPTPPKVLRQEVHSSFSDCYSEIALENQRVEVPTEIVQYEAEIRNEVALYASGPTIDRHQSPLLWWRKNSGTYPRLAILARKYLSAPASSVYSEILFSTAGNVYEDKRSRLLPVHGEMLTFLNRNLPLLKFSYGMDF